MEQLSDLLRQAWAEGVGFGPEVVLLLNLIVGAAAVVSSLTGFGYALVATPFLVLLFPPRVVVPMVMLFFERVRWDPLLLIAAEFLVVLGMIFNRINVCGLTIDIGPCLNSMK